MDGNAGEKSMGGHFMIRRSRMPGGWEAGKLGGWTAGRCRQWGLRPGCESPSLCRKAFNCLRTVSLLFLLSLFVFPVTGISAAESTSLTYRLKWLFNTSVVGDLYADREGYFADRGLTVTVKAGGPERDAIKELELGYADFGVASADQVIRALAKGSPVVVVCQLFQENPLQWIYRTAKVRLKNLSDLKGKTIGVTFGGNDEAILRALLAKGGIDERAVNLFSVRYDYTPFLKKEVNIWPVYRNAEGLILAQKLEAEGESVDFFEPARFGVRFVANSVVTSREMATQHPETVRRFLSALMEGWRSALAPKNQQKAIALLQEYDKDTSRDMLVQQLEATRQIVIPKTGVAIGAIDTNAWRQTEQIMLDQKLIPEDVHIDQALLPEFLPEPTGSGTTK